MPINTDLLQYAYPALKLSTRCPTEFPFLFFSTVNSESFKAPANTFSKFKFQAPIFNFVGRIRFSRAYIFRLDPFDMWEWDVSDTV